MKEIRLKLFPALLGAVGLVFLGFAGAIGLLVLMSEVVPRHLVAARHFQKIIDEVIIRDRPSPQAVAAANEELKHLSDATSSFYFIHSMEDFNRWRAEFGRTTSR